MSYLLQNIESEQIREKWIELLKDLKNRTEIKLLVINDKIDESLLLVGKLYPNLDDQFDVLIKNFIFFSKKYIMLGNIFIIKKVFIFN